MKRLLPILAVFAAAAAAPPNIVFFLVDDMGWQDTSVPFHTSPTALNQRYRTPNMEKLAAEGVKFTQAYASSLCSPSRVSALTGMNAARHNVTNWTLRKNTSPDSPDKVVQPPAWNMNGVCMEDAVERTMKVTPLPFLLREAGYRTIHAGKAHFGAKDTPGENPLNLGFDVNIAGHAAGGPGSYWGQKNYSAAWRSPERIWDVPGLEKYHGTDTYLTEAITLESIAAVEKAVADKKPFYLYLAHYAVHAPFEKDPRFYQKYKDAGLNEHDAVYASMIEGMDKSLGDVMAALKRLGVDDNTVVLFLSDNGSPQENTRNLPLRGHKIQPYEGGIRVPMLARVPGLTKAGSVCASPVIIEDFFPPARAGRGREGQNRAAGGRGQFLRCSRAARPIPPVLSSGTSPHLRPDSVQRDPRRRLEAHPPPRHRQARVVQSPATSAKPRPLRLRA
ncbi:MAG: sulfatase-like hydrolase/transferase [Kiritimatiellia bacterium]